MENKQASRYYSGHLFISFITRHGLPTATTVTVIKTKNPPLRTMDQDLMFSQRNNPYCDLLILVSARKGKPIFQLNKINLILI